MDHVMTFCGNCSCGCPELFVDAEAPAERRYVLTDDFGARIRMSREQLGLLAEQLPDALRAI